MLFPSKTDFITCGFSGDSKWLATVSAEPESRIVLWQWDKEKVPHHSAASYDAQDDDIEEETGCCSQSSLAYAVDQCKLGYPRYRFAADNNAIVLRSRAQYLKQSYRTSDSIVDSGIEEQHCYRTAYVDDCMSWLEYATYSSSAGHQGGRESRLHSNKVGIQPQRPLHLHHERTRTLAVVVQLFRQHAEGTTHITSGEGTGEKPPARSILPLPVMLEHISYIIPRRLPDGSEQQLIG